MNFGDPPFHGSIYRGLLFSNQDCQHLSGRAGFTPVDLFTPGLIARLSWQLGIAMNKIQLLIGYEIRMYKELYFQIIGDYNL